MKTKVPNNSFWQQPMSDDEIRASVRNFGDQNILYGQNKILGFPGTTPESISIEIFNGSISAHSNNIGMHTNKDETLSEVGFGGTQAAEREVISMCAELLNGDPTKIDGYISPGGTEANICGCWMGRDVDSGKPTAIVCSFLSHYSIVKAANILQIGTKVNQNGSGLHALGTDENGHLLLHQFKESLFNIAKQGIKNIIVIGNAGTTMLGSVDNIPEMNTTIDAFKKCFPEVHVHFHVDAAFGGFVIPFLEGLPNIGFENEHVDSVTIDVHKMGLSPYGSGIILARRGYFERIISIAPYIPGDDCTICGSRGGSIALSCWAVMKKLGQYGYELYAKNHMNLATYARRCFQNMGLKTFENDINIIAVKGNLSEQMLQKYITHIHLGFPQDLSSPGQIETQPVWNLVVMRHTTKALIEEFCEDFKKSQ